MRTGTWRVSPNASLTGSFCGQGSGLLLLLLSISVLMGCATTPVPYPEGPARLELPAAEPSGYQTAPTFFAKDLLPAELLSGPHHRIVDPVVNDGFTNHYLIHSDFGVYETFGLEMTRTRVQEINAIATLQQTKKTEAYRKGFQRSMKALALSPIRQVKRVARNPFYLVVIIPSAVASPIGLAVEASKFARLGLTRGAKEYIGFSKVKRYLASELGVDPESPNPVLQAELNDVAWAYLGGEAPVRIVDGFVPGLPLVTLNVVKDGKSLAQGIDAASGGLKRKSTRSKLWRMDVAQADIKVFLRHEMYTSLEKRTLVDALYSMDDAANREAVVLSANKVPSRVCAEALVRQATMMAEYDREVERIRRLIVHDRLVLCYTESEVLLLPLSGDYLAWTSEVARLTRDLPVACPEDLPVRRREVWLAGGATPRFLAECSNMQFAVHLDSDTVLASWDAKSRVELARSGNRTATAVLVPHVSQDELPPTQVASNLLSLWEKRK